MAPISAPRSVAVIGGGIIGLFCALELQEAGLSVQVIEPDQPGGRQAASFGNGTWINEGAIMPIALPGLWKAVPGFLLDPSGPLVIRWRYLHRLLPWLIRFVLAGRSWGRVRRDLPARHALLRGAVAAYRARAAEARTTHLIGPAGVMYIYRSQQEYEADSVAWALRREFGIPCTIYSRGDLHELLPELSADYVTGVRILPSCSLGDPGGFCAGLAQLFIQRGGSIVKARATAFDIVDQRLRAVVTDQGKVPCARAILAAGIGSRPLARQLGDNIPMIAERGYHVNIEGQSLCQNASIMPADGKMAVAATVFGLRLAGQVELADPDAPPDWSRAMIQLDHARRMFPQTISAIDRGAYGVWMGNRPSTPDSLPVIGPARTCPDVIHAFGHGHTGMVMAPATGRLVRDLIMAAAPAIDPAPYAARRFRHVA